jgi:RND family efflux transporter MFP subunit
VRRRRRWARLLLAAVPLAALPAVGAGCDRGNTEPGAVASPGALPVKTLPVRRVEGYEVSGAFAGRIVSRRTSELGFVRGSRLDAVLVDEGEPVEAGQELARLTQRKLDAQRRELEARVAETEAQLALAKLTRQRRERLLKTDSISTQRYDEALYEERALASQLAATQASLEAVRADIDLSTLRAPYAGTITARLVDEGTVVAPGQTLLRIVETGAMEFRVGLPPKAAERLDPDQVYPVEVEGRSYPARLATVIPSVEPDTRTVTAVLRFEEPPAAVANGSLGRLSLSTPREGVGFWLPISALTEGRRGLWSAFVLVEGSVEGDGASVPVERRELQLLHVDSDRAFVRGTLDDGERVVATGLQRLVPGQRVRPVE